MHLGSWQLHYSIANADGKTPSDTPQLATRKRGLKSTNTPQPRSIRRLNALLFLSLSLATAWGGTPSAAGAATSKADRNTSGMRVMTVEDLLRREGSWRSAISAPDGRSLVIPVRRGMLGEATRRPEMRGFDKTDLWLLPMPGGEARRLTDGARDGSGVMLPVWSPSAQKLLYLSTEGGDNLRPYVWDQSTGTRKRLSEQAVDIDMSGRFYWLDDQRVLTALLPPGKRPLWFVRDVQTQELAPKGWATHAAGKVPSLSVMEGGIPVPSASRNEIAIIDTQSGEVRRIAQGHFIQMAPSRDRRSVLVVEQTMDKPAVIARVGLVDLGKASAPVWLEALQKVSGEVTTAWSPAGDNIAILAQPEGESGSRLWIASAQDGSTREVTAVAQPDTVMWSAEGLLVRGKAGTRKDWHLVDLQAGTAKPVTVGLASAPGQLLQMPCPGRMVGLVAGDLWSVDVAAGKAENLTQAFKPELQSFEWTSGSVRREAGDPVLLKTSEGGLVIADLQACKASLRPLTPPRPTASLTAFDPRSGTATFEAHDADGSRLWTGTTGAWHLRMESNKHFAQIRYGEHRLLPYHGTDGEALKAELVLPVGYQKGKRYPTVVWLYPNVQIEEITPFLPTDFTWWQPELLAAKGYVVVIPMSSLKPGEPRAIYLEVAKDTMPAVEAAVQAGYADPERLGIFGESYGGWGVYSILTQTKRFKAAVATLGIFDLPSYATIFNARDRYTTDTVPDFGHRVREDSDWDLQGPFWERQWRWWLNSPLTHIDRVETPILLAQGDMDGVPIQQGEMAFTSLAAQGKRVRFLRYWGEQHEFASPANIIDLWNQIGNWFDHYLKPGGQHQ